jgi:hypothetical protein
MALTPVLEERAIINLGPGNALYWKEKFKGFGKFVELLFLKLK